MLRWGHFLVLWGITSSRNHSIFQGEVVAFLCVKPRQQNRTARFISFPLSPVAEKRRTRVEKCDSEMWNVQHNGATLANKLDIITWKWIMETKDDWICSRELEDVSKLLRCHLDLKEPLRWEAELKMTWMNLHRHFTAEMLRPVGGDLGHEQVSKF